MKHESTKNSDETLEKLLVPEKLEHCFECGICTASCPVAKLIFKHYNPRMLLQTVSKDLETAITEAQPWLCAWCDRCYKRCPQGLNLPQIFLLTRNIAAERGYVNKFSEALEIIGREIPFAGVCSLICFNRVNDPTAIKAIERYVADYELKKKEKTIPISKKRREKIAVIGSGPAGLMAAYELAKKGYPVTVFESLPEPGGMLRAGIPEFRLPRKVLNTEIERIKSLGVEIRTNVTVGKNLTINGLLKDDYKAVFIATGAPKSRKLRIKGEKLKGIMHAIDLLREVNMEKKVKLGNRIAVIGGGNVAIDAARAVLRLGAKEVTIMYRRSREEMPANSWEVKHGEKEGVKIQFLVAPKKILGKNGRLVAVECVRMELGEPDESGRRRPIPIENSEFTIQLDTLILAIGESPDPSFLPKGIEVTRQKTITVDPITLETSLPEIFAGGDVVSGPATVMEAIVAGRKAAFAIDNYLTSRGA
ncbi:MAG: FAD-dependent oxidoreductase [Candidatus Bathyarchaeota archaeon]|nr:MAG: FAD-dependent oxidoreductase [Candidatus Bathyarchaeota archaeon]